MAVAVDDLRVPATDATNVNEAGPLSQCAVGVSQRLSFMLAIRATTGLRVIKKPA